MPHYVLLLLLLLLATLYQTTETSHSTNAGSFGHVAWQLWLSCATGGNILCNIWSNL